MTLLDNSGPISIFSADYATEEPSSWEKLLSEEELKKAYAYTFHDKKSEFIICRGIMKQLLSNYIKLPIQEIIIHYTPAGKPFLANEKAFFNISHSNGKALFALSATTQMGIDIEMIRPIKELFTIAKNYFSNEEKKILQNCSESEKEKTFFKLWTKKEAVLKAAGTGFNKPFPEPTSHYIIKELSPFPGYVGFLAYSATNRLFA
ncbi:MAG: 4'-phosphopantetheinyl transferase superfamily protein [Chlamydiales bacterium]|nr:4'-phosphopantetheinyl transferase superfamily protein [Chlamydiales bacterium]